MEEKKYTITLTEDELLLIHILLLQYRNVNKIASKLRQKIINNLVLKR